MGAWIGVDLDGTLAEYHGWGAQGNEIGRPIPEMVERVKKWLSEGKEVKIMTARVSKMGAAFFRQQIEEWCMEHIGQRLDVTCVKDYMMIELWDDRAVRVIANTGQPCCNHHAK